MKIKELIGSAYQTIGLGLINTLARNGAYKVHKNIAYGDKTRNRLDYYQVKGEQKRSTVLFLYGGSWNSGSKDTYRFVADTLTSHGLDVVIPDYRLYPQVRFSEIQSDVVAAAEWVASNTVEPIFVIGHSAGAQLGALLCLNKGLLDLQTVEKIKGFVGLAGPYDFYPFTEEEHWDLFSPEERYPESQAVNYVRPDGPPMYLLHGEDDTRVRRGHSKSLMEKIQAEGGHAAREVYANMGHVDIIMGFTLLHRRTSPVIRDIIQFLTNGVNYGAK